MPIVSEEHKRKKRNQILMGAQYCFAKNGYHITSMDSIVKQSGLSKGAIYNYFKSKKEIYLELMRGIVVRELEPIHERIANIESNLEKIGALFECYCDLEPMSYEQKEAFFVQLDFQLSSSRKTEMMNVLEDIYKNMKLDLVKKILMDGKDSGEVHSSLHIDIYAHMFWSFIDGINMQRILFPDLPYQEILTSQKHCFIKRIAK